MASSRKLEFPAFPFQPYPIQTQLMNSVYHALQTGGVAIIESPTGTGKTLSLICSVLQWLQDRRASRESERDMRVPDSESNCEPAWMRDFSGIRQQQIKDQRRDRIARKKKAEKKSESRQTLFFAQPAQDGDNEKFTKPSSPYQELDEDDENFVLDDYDSSGDGSASGGIKRKCSKAPSSSSSDEESEDKEEETPLKVFFCSRTHSQLSQFIKELRRTTFSTSLKTVSVGSRKSLCINQDVLRLGHSSRINERCLELQMSKSNQTADKKVLVEQKRHKKMASGCPMMKKQGLQRKFMENAWESDVLDIEDMVQLGKKLGTCPYYGSRRMVPVADLVVLPYQSLLHGFTRESIGVNLKDSVVVIDEAHNLVDSISNMHSCCVSMSQLEQVQSLLSVYLGKFKEKLGAGNRRYIQILLILIQAFLKRLTAAGNANGTCGQGDRDPGSKTGIGHAEKVEVLTINDFLFSLDIDNINMFKLWQYMKDSKIVHKVSNYCEKVSVHQESLSSGMAKGSLEGSTTLSGFHGLAELILALMNADTDGRILVVPCSVSSHNGGQTEAHVKFVMLNAARAFQEVVDQSHAVVLAGGTLQPIEELRYRLFPHLKESQIHVFSCGHIVPAKSVLALAVAHGPTGKTFDFTYQSRTSPEMMEELGRLLFNLSLIVPEGMVVFLPSFDYEQQLCAAWKSSGILDKLQRKKVLFREPRDAASVELTLHEYKESILGAANQNAGKTGAVLLCVVGGKMSEGINFNDGMGRCVVMVGLPYPSPTDPELKERMKFIDTLSATSFTKSMPQGFDHSSRYRGRDYYENLCMKAVNQSIGRAIRHIGDYASILLVDVRYMSVASTSGPTSKLPNWIKDQLIKVTGNFGEVHKLLHQFFKDNKKERENICIA